MALSDRAAWYRGGGHRYLRPFPGRRRCGATGGQVQPGALILESTLSSARDFAETVFPLLSRLVLMRYGWDTAACVAQLRSPVLVLHSPEDEIMPYRLGEIVFQSGREPKRFVTLRGDHNSGFLRSQPQYEQALADFVAES